MGARGVWMKLRNRKVLARLMAINEVTQRDLAEAAGWKSHSYVGRLLRGEVTNLEIEPAVKIAKYLGVGVDDLFLTKHVTKPKKVCKDKFHQVA